MSKHTEIPKTEPRLNRRSLIGGGAGLLALRGLGGFGLLTLAGMGLNGGEAEAASQKDRNILNFALNLEYLEAEFYLAATGQAALSEAQTSGVGTPGATTGRLTTTFADPLLENAADELTADEVSHVNLLRSVLGKFAVAKPAITLNPLGSYETQSAFLNYSRAFEDVGVTAYGGAARLIKSKTILEAAARILAVEAYHAGNIRLFAVQKEVEQTDLGAKDEPATPTNFFPTDEGSLSYIRSVDEVLEVVAPFFPNGLNGKIR